MTAYTTPVRTVLLHVNANNASDVPRALDSADSTEIALAHRNKGSNVAIPDISLSLDAISPPPPRSILPNPMLPGDAGLSASPGTVEVISRAPVSNTTKRFLVMVWQQMQHPGCATNLLRHALVDCEIAEGVDWAE